MTRWVDQPAWGGAVAKALITALANTIYENAEMRQVWVNASMEQGMFPQSINANTTWTTMLRDAHDFGHLEELLREAQAFRPALDAQLAQAFAEGPALHWYRCQNRYEPRMLGPGSKQALINRSKLSRNLEDIIRDGYPVCSIQGKSGTGKSYSRHLIQYLASEPDVQSEPIRVDIADTFKGGVNATQFATWLADRLGMPSSFNVDPNTHDTSIADALARKFLARFPDLPARRRWIFIDGLDRPGVTDDVHVFVAHLALAAASGELPQTRLFITGHRGDFHSDVMAILCEEQIDPIDRSHLIAFFVDIAAHIDQPLGDGEADELADKVLERASLTDLRRLGVAASEVALERFKGAGNGN